MQTIQHTEMKAFETFSSAKKTKFWSKLVEIL